MGYFYKVYTRQKEFKKCNNIDSAWRQFSSLENAIALIMDVEELNGAVRQRVYAMNSVSCNAFFVGEFYDTRRQAETLYCRIKILSESGERHCQYFASRRHRYFDFVSEKTWLKSRSCTQQCLQLKTFPAQRWCLRPNVVCRVKFLWRSESISEEYAMEIRVVSGPHN